MRGLLVAALACAGCSLLTDLGDVRSPDALPDDAGDDAAPDAAPCSPDLGSDPQSCGRCGHGCLGGACMNGQCAPVSLALGEVNADNLGIDATTLYWTKRGATFSSAVIRTMPKTGAAPTSLTAGTDCSTMTVGGPAIYIARNDTPQPVLYMEPKVGGAPEVKVASASEIIAVTADDTAVFYAVPDSTNMTYVAYRMPHGGTPAHFGSPTLDVATAVVDDAHYYGSNGAVILRLPKDGSSTTFDILVSTSTFNLNQIAVTGTEVVYSLADLTLHATPKLGNGSVDRLVAGAAQANASLDNRTFATNGRWLAWIDLKGIWACDLTACESTRVMVAMSKTVSSVALDAAAVYYTDWQNAGVYMVALP